MDTTNSLSVTGIDPNGKETMVLDDDLESLFGGGGDDDDFDFNTMFLDEALLNADEDPAGTGNAALLTPRPSPLSETTMELSFPTLPSEPVSTAAADSPADHIDLTSTAGTACQEHTGHTRLVNSLSSSRSDQPMINVLSDAEIDTHLSEEFDVELARQARTPSAGQAQSSDTPLASSNSDTILMSEFVPIEDGEAVKNVGVPRRIDNDLEGALALAPALTLGYTRMPEVSAALELDKMSQKVLNRSLQEYLLGSPSLAYLILGKRPNHSTDTKHALIRAAFHILTHEGWGERWFGAGCRTAGFRTRFWPQDSTVLLYHFVKCLNRVIRDAKAQRAPSRLVRSRHFESSGNVTGTLSTPGQISEGLVSQSPSPPTEAAIDGRYGQGPSASSPDGAIPVEVPDNAPLTFALSVLTPRGLQTITTQEEWDEAVAGVYHVFGAAHMMIKVLV
ncbi:hypothetical protein QBC47DRAFT_463791 [Echria macrotheca]|uniref:Uncharacterized protein n=1 Tax=Echria macrotheca TaxID=438768 RepID=A0AAJ0F1W5_9PEZI|nr:hypothetical protein QBC47DRAFT_463791 [Echria macrotheca]